MDSSGLPRREITPSLLDRDVKQTADCSQDSRPVIIQMQESTTKHNSEDKVKVENVGRADEKQQRVTKGLLYFFSIIHRCFVLD